MLPSTSSAPLLHLAKLLFVGTLCNRIYFYSACAACACSSALDVVSHWVVCNVYDGRLDTYSCSTKMVCGHGFVQEFPSPNSLISTFTTSQGSGTLSAHHMHIHIKRKYNYTYTCTCANVNITYTCTISVCTHMHVCMNIMNLCIFVFMYLKCVFMYV